MLTSQMEGYAQSRANGLNKSDAYRANYNCSNMLPKTVNEEACILDSHPKIAPRIQELMGAVASEIRAISVHTAETLAAEAMTNLSLARDLGQIAAANKSVELTARLTGNLEPSVGATEMRITKVTVVLPSQGAVIDVEEYEVSDEILHLPTVPDNDNRN